MTQYNRNFTDELRERLSIVDVVGRRVPLNKKGQNHWGCCPFHNEKTPSFSVNEEKGFYHCFGCGEHGDIISFVMKTENMDFKSAIAELAQIAGIKMPDYKPKSAEQIKREETYIDITESATKLFQEKLFTPDGAHALEYIRKRGFSDDAIRKYRLGYAPKNNVIANKFVNTKFETLSATGLVRHGDYGNYDFFRDKLMFPIMNPAGQVIAFSGRSLDGSEPKYINTTDTDLFHKRKTLFGLNFARDAIHRNNRSIVVEGQIDAIQMQTHGFPETVAPLGTALTEDHIAILCKLNRNIIFCFDGDNAGQKAAQRACGIVLSFLRDNADFRFAFMQKNKDPDELLKKQQFGLVETRSESVGMDQIETVINSAMPLVDFLWTIANKNFDVYTPNGRSQANNFLRTELDKITDFGLRSEFYNDYKERKIAQWEKTRSAIGARVPSVDQITANKIAAVIEQHPILLDNHGDFLATLNFANGDPNKSAPMNFSDAEKFIISLKLQKYLEQLNEQKKDLVKILMSGDSGVSVEIARIDDEIAKQKSRLDQLIGF
ncbi:DNA primase [Lachnospiraceae bacterium OttesenSCG-928-E19]|nr:DNA primase [Lachnospiraceae bacterium OttesenSCG-928-E19]